MDIKDLVIQYLKLNLKKYKLKIDINDYYFFMLLKCSDIELTYNQISLKFNNGIFNFYLYGYPYRYDYCCQNKEPNFGVKKMTQ
jgi:hypothetical protein